jgi:trk system potassium uptake protein TrkH
MSTDEAVRALMVAARGAVVLKYTGQLLLVVAVTCIAPFLFSLFHEGAAAGLPYLAAGLVLSVPCAFFARLPAPSRLRDHEALVITALAFVLAPLALVAPVMSHGMPFLDAWLETVSAVTSTGLTTLSSVRGLDPTFLFTRAWMQWYGGLGIGVLSLALLVGPGMAARRLALAGMERQELVADTRLHARRVLGAYLVLTLAGIPVLRIAGLDWDGALLHALAGVSTGGFSSYDDSLAGFATWSARAALMLLSFCGAVSLALYHPAYFRGWRALGQNPELRALIVACLLASIALALCMGLVADLPWPRVLANAPLVAVSAQTGAGFTSVEIAALDPASKLVLVVSMLVGGGTGSTSGGIKLLRLLILLRMLQLLIRRACLPPDAVVRPALGGHRLESHEVEHALMIILLFMLIILLSWLPFLALGYPPLDSLFEVVSATTTTGLSCGITAPDLPSLLKGVLGLDMLLGRLEGVALLLVLYPRTWLGR